MNSNKSMIKAAYIAIVILSWTSIFSLIAVKTDNQIIKLWKEILVILFYFFCLLQIFKAKKGNAKVLITCLILPVYILILYFLLSYKDNRILVFYQFKTDIIPFLFPIGLLCILKNSDDAFSVYNKICKIFIYIGIINSFFILIERIFTSWFLVFLEIDNLNNQSGKSGLRLDNTSDGLRAMGTMTSFINSGTLMVLAIFILLESGVFKRKTKIILLPVFIIAAILTTYKTALIALGLYFPIKLFLFFFQNKSLKKIILGGYTAICFGMMAFFFNDMYLYNQIKDSNLHDAAYSSIYMRVVQHQDIFNDVQNKSLFTGVGIGVNGTQGPPELKYSSKALDSTYINILSNYGLIGLLFYIFIFLILIFKYIFWGGLGDQLALYIVFFHLGVEFFANNMLMNFPLNIYMSIFLMFSLFYKKTRILRDS